jgi:preprotein translocase subunit SecD
MLKRFLKNSKAILLSILALTIIAIYIDLPRIPIKFEYKNIKVDKVIGGYTLDLFNGKFFRDLEIKKGLDIAGGVTVLLKADMSNIPEQDRPEAISSLKDIIERRVNLLGISEANVQTSNFKDEYRIIVELAGVLDTTQALDTIGQVAQLEFKELTEIPLQQDNQESEDPELIEPTNFDFVSTGLSGADLRKATVIIDSANGGGFGTNEPQIQLQFNSDGIKKFKDITTRNVGKQVAIFLDDQLLLAPTVQTPINDGRAVITGEFTIDEANSLAAQLNAGALPVPVEVLEQKTVGPTLGKESVDKSIAAGILGLILVIGFMVSYYKKLGILASLSLLIYGILTLAVYKLIPVVITLPGLAGFILSIGMAVDANILIFERIKEERRSGKPLVLAIENGFGRSWDAIRDANTATLLTGFILFNPFDWSFLPTSGPVRGFALTLGLGIIVSLFTGIFVTRNLIRVFYRK